jgi:hypothetical protein
MVRKSLFLLCLFISLISKSVEAQKHLALIISGEYEKNLDINKFNSVSETLWQYTFKTWEKLILNQKFNNEHVIVFYRNGNDWHDINPMLRNLLYDGSRYGLEKITDFPSDTVSINVVVNKLKESLQSNDSLTVYFLYNSSEITSSCPEMYLTSGSINTDLLISRLKQITPNCEVFWIATSLNSNEQ